MRIEQFSDEHGIYVRASEEAFLLTRDEARNHLLYLRELQAENAKLRELVRDLYGCVSHANEQDWFYFERHMLGCGMSCTVNGEACGLSVFADRMKELGVDDG